MSPCSRSPASPPCTCLRATCSGCRTARTCSTWPGAHGTCGEAAWGGAGQARCAGAERTQPACMPACLCACLHLLLCAVYASQAGPGLAPPTPLPAALIGACHRPPHQTAPPSTARRMQPGHSSQQFRPAAAVCGRRGHRAAPAALRLLRRWGGRLRGWLGGLARAAGKAVQPASPGGVLGLVARVVRGDMGAWQQISRPSPSHAIWPASPALRPATHQPRNLERRSALATLCSLLSCTACHPLQPALTHCVPTLLPLMCRRCAWRWGTTRTAKRSSRLCSAASTARLLAAAAAQAGCTCRPGGVGPRTDPPCPSRKMMRPRRSSRLRRRLRRSCGVGRPAGAPPAEAGAAGGACGWPYSAFAQRLAARLPDLSARVFTCSDLLPLPCIASMLVACLVCAPLK